MRKFLLSLTLFCTAFGLMAQQKTIRGTVSDPDGVIPFANVVIKGTTTGTATDLDGKYEITVPVGSVLQFSAVSVVPQEFKIDANTPNVLNVKLATETTELDEFVVVGYGVVKKSDLTGAISGVNEEKLKESVVTSIDQALQGRVSGVQVTASSGQPGAGTSVRIRGTSSLTGSNEPLYVVDGMPIGGGVQGGGYNPLNSINPADIVSMEILKDASATAIYGSRAANGVIMITTRKGKEGESPKITYDGNFSVSQISNKLDMMDLKEYASYITDPLVLQGYNQKKENVDPYLTIDPSFMGSGTDWQDEMFRLAIGHSHQLSLTGGSKETQYALSLGYQNQEGTLINTNFERFNSRVSLENQTTSWLKLGINMAFTHISQSKQAGFDAINTSNSIGTDVVVDDSPLMQALTSLPSSPVKDIYGNYVEKASTTEGGAKYNAVADAQNSPIYVTSNNFLGQVFADIEPIKDLHWRTEFGVDYTAQDDKQFKPTSEYNPTNSLTAYWRKNFYWRLASTLNYFKRFNAKHSLTAMVTVEAQESTWDAVHYKKTNYPTNDPIDPTYQNSNLGDYALLAGYKGSNAMLSYLGRLNYNFADRYLITASGRFDGSSNFSPDNRWGFFPSFSLAWRIDQEHFIKETKAINTISNFKLRAGYGETGNSGNTIAYLSTLRAYDTYDQRGYIQDRWANEGLKWETNWQINAGLDFGLFNNRISLTVDGFYKQNEDLIVTADPGISIAKDEYLYTYPPQINLGSIRNTGFEISLNTVNISTQIANRKFEWTTDFAFSFVRNKVVDLGGEFRTGYSKNFKTIERAISRSEEGKAPGMFYGYKTSGVIKNEDQLNAVDRSYFKGIDVGDVNYVDNDGNGILDENDMTWIGDPNPDFTGGLGNTLSYGPWSLTIFITGSYGNDVYNLLRSKLEGMDNAYINQLNSVRDFARVATDANGKKYVVNSNTDIPRPNVNGGPVNANVVSDRYVEDGSYIRIQNIALSYRFPERWMSKIHVSDLRLSANVQNVYTFTNYTGYNPEVSNANVLVQGIDTGSYPAPRMYTLGLTFSF